MTLPAENQQTVEAARADAERMFNESACERLAASSRQYQDEHGYYLPTLAWLLNETRRERDAALRDLVAQAAEAEEVKTALARVTSELDDAIKAAVNSDWDQEDLDGWVDARAAAESLLARLDGAR